MSARCKHYDRQDMLCVKRKGKAPAADLLSTSALASCYQHPTFPCFIYIQLCERRVLVEKAQVERSQLILLEESVNGCTGIILVAPNIIKHGWPDQVLHHHRFFLRWCSGSTAPYLARQPMVYVQLRQRRILVKYTHVQYGQLIIGKPTVVSR